MIRTTYNRQGEGTFHFEYYTKRGTPDDITLLGWGRYGRSSVLAGQTMKQAISFFNSEAELNAALIEAGINPEEVRWSNKWTEPQVSLSHLPDDSDW